jgi:hypothetical protein
MNRHVLTHLFSQLVLHFKTPMVKMYLKVESEHKKYHVGNQDLCNDVVTTIIGMPKRDFTSQHLSYHWPRLDHIFIRLGATPPMPSFIAQSSCPHLRTNSSPLGINVTTPNHLIH